MRRKTNGVVDRHFLWDNGQLLALLDGTGQRIAEYAYLPSGEPLSYTTSGGTDYYHVDLRGNVVGLSNGTAAVQQTNYAPWGAVENQTGFTFDSTRLGWKGNVWEGGKTNLYYVRNRWYDPVSRGFISEDPIGIGGGLNTYAFGGNDPANFRDPSGLCPRWKVYIDSQGNLSSERDGEVQRGHTMVDFLGGDWTCGCNDQWAVGDGTEIDCNTNSSKIEERRTGGAGGGNRAKPKSTTATHSAEVRACLLEEFGNGLTEGVVAGAVVGARRGFVRGLEFANSRALVRATVIVGTAAAISTSEVGGAGGPVTYALGRITEYLTIVGATTAVYTVGGAVTVGVGTGLANAARSCSTQPAAVR